MHIKDAISDLTAMQKTLGEMKSILDSPRNVRKSAVVGDTEFTKRVSELKEVGESIGVLISMCSRGATVFDLGQLVRGGETMYLLCVRRHFEIIERLGNPRRFIGENQLSDLGGMLVILFNFSNK